MRLSLARLLAAFYAGVGAGVFGWGLHESGNVSWPHAYILSLLLALVLSALAGGGRLHREGALGSLGAFALLAEVTGLGPTLLSIAALLTVPLTLLPVGHSTGHRVAASVFHAIAMLGGFIVHIFGLVVLFNVGSSTFAPAALVSLVVMMATASWVGALLQRDETMEVEDSLARGLLLMSAFASLWVLSTSSIGLAFGALLLFSVPATACYVLALPGIILIRQSARWSCKHEYPAAPLPKAVVLACRSIET